MLKMIVSLTTSPTRLPLIGETLDSIISQVPKPYKIYVNLPKVFERTGETYPDPNILFKEQMETTYKNLVVWNNCGKDLGPVTKLQGTLNIIPEEEDCWIITIDDDIKYLPGLIELFYATILKTGRKDAMGLCGFIYYNNRINAKFSNDPVNILEGYGGCCYHRSFFKKSWNTYLKKCLENNDARLSDDIIISNWLSLNKIRKMIVAAPWINRKLMWSNKCILEYGNKEDALHNGANTNQVENNNANRYERVKIYLNEKKILSDEFK